LDSTIGATLIPVNLRRIFKIICLNMKIRRGFLE
jgi:hypothetical protein